MILDSMKKDYELMYKIITKDKMIFIDGELTKEVKYQKSNRVCSFSSSAHDAVQISMAIQKSQYDGSDESFDKFVVKKMSIVNDNK